MKQRNKRRKNRGESQLFQTLCFPSVIYRFHYLHQGLLQRSYPLSQLYQNCIIMKASVEEFSYIVVSVIFLTLNCFFFSLVFVFSTPHTSVILSKYRFRVIDNFITSTECQQPPELFLTPMVKAKIII